LGNNTSFTFPIFCYFCRQINLIMISVSGLTVEFSGVALFNDVSFLINPRDRVGLTGKNGAGKSTLLKILSGQQPYDQGSVAVPRDTTIGYLPQHMTVSDTQTVFDETMTAFVEIKQLEKDIAQLNEQLATRTDYESVVFIGSLYGFNSPG